MGSFVSYYWMVVAFLCTISHAVIWHKTKKKIAVPLAMMWFHCAMWGMTTGALNVPWVKVLNIIIIFNAATFGLIAMIMKLHQLINDKHI